MSADAARRTLNSTKNKSLTKSCVRRNEDTGDMTGSLRGSEEMTQLNTSFPRGLEVPFESQRE